MPEGPSLVIAKEAMKNYKGKIVNSASGISRQLDPSIFQDRQLKNIKTFGKELLFVFNRQLILSIHFMMFGSYRFDESKTTNPRLHLGFDDGTFIKFYSCSLKVMQGKLDAYYDFSADIMNKGWDPKKAMKKLRDLETKTMICDALLNQSIFAGLGNIIKNEVLFRCKVQPESLVASLSTKKCNELINDAPQYARLFLRWKKAGVLKKHWEAHTKSICPRDGEKIIKKYTGKQKRRSFYCNHCQKLYGGRIKETT